MVTPDDTPSLSSEEMIRRAREELAKPRDESLPASVPAESAPPTPKPVSSQKHAKRLTRIAPTLGKPRASQANSTRVFIAILVVLALIGLAVAIMVTSISTAP